MDDASLIKVVLAFITANSPDQWEAMVRTSSGLLSLETDALLDQMLQEAPDGDPLRTTIELRRALLRRCREQGVDEAFAAFKGPVTDSDASAEPTAAQKKIQQLEQMQALDEDVDPEATMFHPDVYRAVVLRGVLKTYDSMLTTQEPDSLDYGQTQSNRAKVLHQLAGMKGEKRHQRSHEALEAYDHALRVQEDAPRDYALTQSNRANLLYQLAVMPDEDHIVRLGQALEAYETALDRLEEIPHLYIRTQLARVALLRDMAGLPGENRGARLYAALEGFNKLLEFQKTSAKDYAQTQLPRANLLRELAGLHGEDRAPRMYQALEAYDNCLERLPDDTLEYAQTEINRASLLQEIANLPDEDRNERLKQALTAAVHALQLLQDRPDGKAQYRTAQRMLNYTRKTIITAEDVETFDRWWVGLAGFPQPDWLGDAAKIGA